jgi:hypothetical protein
MTELVNTDKSFAVIECRKCSMEYLVVESIPIIVNAESDFYKYNRKFKRLVKIKNEEN